MTDLQAYRSIYCRLVDDEDFQGMSRDARLLFYTIRVSPECGPLGLFRFYPGLFRSRLGFSIEEIEAALRELEAGRWIFREKGYLLVRNALRFEPSFNPAKDEKHRLYIYRQLEALRGLSLSRILLAGMGLPIPSGWGPSEGPGGGSGAPSMVDGPRPSVGASEGLRGASRGVSEGIPSTEPEPDPETEPEPPKRAGLGASSPSASGPRKELSVGQKAELRDLFSEAARKWPKEVERIEQEVRTFVEASPDFEPDVVLSALRSTIEKAKSSPGAYFSKTVRARQGLRDANEAEAEEIRRSDGFKRAGASLAPLLRAAERRAGEPVGIERREG